MSIDEISMGTFTPEEMADAWRADHSAGLNLGEDPFSEDDPSQQAEAQLDAQIEAQLEAQLAESSRRQAARSAGEAYILRRAAEARAALEAEDAALAAHNAQWDRRTAIAAKIIGAFLFFGFLIYGCSAGSVGDAIARSL